MKKILGTLLMFCLSTWGHAQNSSSSLFQFSDPGFEKFTQNGEPGNGWNSFASAIGKYTSAMGVDLKKQSPNPEVITPGANQSSRALKLFSKEIAGPLGIKANANGNLTTGVINMGAMSATDPGNHNRTLLNNPKHQLRFAGRPDQVVFYAKFKAGGNNQKKCGQVKFILHDRCEYQDPEIASQRGNRIGGASSFIHESNEWKQYTLPFNYDKPTPNEQYLLASITTNPTPGESVGDVLCIDEIRFVYFHALSALSYEGAEIQFHEDTLFYDLSSIGYKQEKLKFTTKGAGASIEKKYNAATGLLTLIVKGNDCVEEPEHTTTYQIQFNKDGLSPLDQPLASLDSLDRNSTYALYNEHFTTYASFHADHANYVWSTNMTGDSSHELHSESYAQPFDILNQQNAWMVIPAAEGKFYLYNMEAKKFLKTPGYNGKTSPCTFSQAPEPLQIEDLGNGNFAFTSTGHEQDYCCAAPNNNTSPISIWKKEDTGAAWQLKRNSNIQADRQIVEEYYSPRLGKKITSLSQINLKKTYILHNEHYSAYAIYAPEYSQKIVWTAEMKGGDKDHPLNHQEYANKAKLMNVNSNWMLIPQEDGYYLYNLGAKKYLSTPITTTENTEKGCFFSNQPVKMYIEDLGDGKFAFTSSKDPKDYMCAAPQLTTPISNWQKTDPGAAWELTENLDVAADADIIEQFYVPKMGSQVKQLSQIDLQKTYVLRNDSFHAYAIYAPKYSKQYLWSAEMKGNKNQQVKNESYSTKAPLTHANSSWMLIPQEDGFYLYNVGAKQYLSSPIEENQDKGCFFSQYPVKLYATATEEGKFTFTASRKDKDYICATPQLDVPISNWTANDQGSAWTLIQNPNVKADTAIIQHYQLPTLGKKIEKLSTLQANKTYLLRNPQYTAFAVFNATQSTEKIWAAGMVGDLNHPLMNESCFQQVDVKQNNSSWMILAKEDGFYCYNMGAKKYLNATQQGYQWGEEPMKIFITAVDSVHFNISDSLSSQNLLCATPDKQGNPISKEKSNTLNGVWEIIENPYIAADPRITTEKPGTALLTDLKYKGTSLEGFQKDKFSYDIIGEYEEGTITYTCEDGENATVSMVYDEVQKILLITVAAQYGGASHQYEINFTKAFTSYTGKMIISMNGMLVAISDNPVDISLPNNNKVDLQLLNFTLEGLGNIGDIHITDVPYAPNAHGDVALQKQQDITIDGETGQALGVLPTTLEGNIINGKLSCTIKIVWNNTPILVNIYPYNATTIDVPAIGIKNKIADLKRNMTNPNLLIYTQEEIPGQTNVIFNNQCQKLKITDAEDFNVTKNFTAHSVEFLRPLSTGISGFILPFDVPVQNLNGKVYELKGLEGNQVSFQLAIGTLKANHPYLVQSEISKENLLKTTSSVEIKKQDEGVDNAEQIMQMGTYVHLDITSTDQLACFSCEDENLPRIKEGKLSPFHTMLQVKDITADHLILVLEEEITGVLPLVGGQIDLQQTVNVYHLNGQLLRQKVPAASALLNLPSGIYIVDGKKVIK